MVSRKKMAVVSGLLGGLVATCAGAAQAHAAAGPGTCTRDLLGNVTCVQRITGEMPPGDGFTAPRVQTCLPTEPLTLPTSPMSNGTTQIGPKVTCAGPAPVLGTADEGDKGDGSSGLARLLS
ncbi:hypothetical protein AQJ66_19120 [Streptomyces bungoensis]|uniref:Intersectin-EH binding protein Ibp1 n=1 Tax=Streptomyces bungoensis TaxID=285568 RepID=A0A101T049_9ACTN|nr:hypothetical protein [Streptomyces bungoensis]KUN83349.1 hypothetical protein AQJ66_19120 [Streptomyces bungoensis]